jgi:integrase
MLAKTLAPATVNRTVTGLKAGLNAAADHDESIVSRRAWEVGLTSLPDAEEPRNVILSEAQVLALIEQAHRINSEFGLLVETAAVTGARVGQLARLAVRDIQANGTAPRLMMPSSRKGQGRKVTHYPVPITPALSEKLIRAAGKRSGPSTLLLKPSGDPWKKSDHSRDCRRAVSAAAMDPEDVTIYALRHTNIVRQLLAGIPIRVVATNHDTSTTMIERNYSRHIGDHSDQLARRALLDTAVGAVTRVMIN